MKFEIPLYSGTFIKRYKRFLADIKLDTGESITAHCPNSGSLRSCTHEGWKVMVSKSLNPNRKYQYTWEMIHNNKCWIGINTAIPNLIAAEAIQENLIPELKGYHELRKEVRYGRNSRIDIFLKNEKELCYVEIKNVTLLENGFYQFPDAVTERGRKHLYELINMVEQGHRAVMLYIIQRNDGALFKPAEHIDPEYTKSLFTAYKKGVEILVYRAEVNPDHIKIINRVDWKFSK